MAPDVVADLLPRVFMSRTSTTCRRSSRPSQWIRVISSCRRVENSAKASTFGMLIELGRLHREEVLEQPVQFVCGRAPVALAAAAHHAELARIAQGMRVHLIAPGRPGHREDRAKMGQVAAQQSAA